MQYSLQKNKNKNQSPTFPPFVYIYLFLRVSLESWIPYSCLAKTKSKSFYQKINPSPTFPPFVFIYLFLRELELASQQSTSDTQSTVVIDFQQKKISSYSDGCIFNAKNVLATTCFQILIQSVDQLSQIFQEPDKVNILDILQSN